jgi:catecholate siderophore receptor
MSPRAVLALATARARCVLLVLVGLSALLGTGVPGAAAQPPETVSGSVVDATGGALTGAAVTLRSAAGERRTLTDAAGRFVFDNVGAGTATLTVAFARFETATLELSGARTGLRVVLQPVPIAEAVVVRAPALVAPRTATATRTDTPLRDVPQAVSVVTRDLIADQTMRSMADVVRFVPGVSMAQGEGHRDAPVIRGNTTTADFFVDGIRDDTQYLRDLYNVERVEVLKGPNGMTFGRGGAGGVINRVTRQAAWMPVRELTLQGGSSAYRRVAADLGDAMSDTVAARLTTMYENSDSYRDSVALERYGVHPTVAFAVGTGTTVRAGYEFFHDERTTDRGVPSFQGRPLVTDPSTFFGRLDTNATDVTVHGLSSTFEHRFDDRLELRNRVSYADYDKFYSNLVPGAVNASATRVALSGYSNGTDRRNLFNQTDVIATARTGRVGHTMLVGMEAGRQATDNLRQTAYFTSIGPTTTSIEVPVDNPTTSLPVTFRPSATDASNHGVATVVAFYAQDQIAITERAQAVVGLRYDRFALDFVNRRNGAGLGSTDNLVSPRLGVIYKPIDPMSVYASYTRSYLPRAGEQLTSLSLTNQAFEPENSRNYEAGVKWDVRPGLSFTTAVYRLIHGNVVVPDAFNPGVSHLVDAERVSGVETELTGRLTDRLSVVTGYAYQNAKITRSISSSVPAGARLGQVPAHSFSLWSRYDISSAWGAGLGVISRSDSFIATDNSVVLPGFTRTDAAVFYSINERIGLQLNVENVFDRRYWAAAHNNNNITPGSPRALRAAVTARF